MESEIEFYTFYKLETTKKLEEYDRYKEQTMSELIKWRENAFKS
jgi:hypothetical protein